MAVFFSQYLQVTTCTAVEGVKSKLAFICLFYLVLSPLMFLLVKTHLFPLDTSQYF